MIIKTFTFNPFQTNCYICHDGSEAVIVDPSCYETWEIEQVLAYVAENDLTIRHLLLTHGHVDHIFGCEAMVQHYGGGFQMHRADTPLLVQAPMHGQMFGTSMEEPPPPTGFLDEGDLVTFGDAEWRVLQAPGHSPGSICFFDAHNKFVHSGDVLFYDSIGRTDLWKGSLPVLMRSIFDTLIPLGDDVRLYPGHGRASTIGRERVHNPFLTGRAV